MFVLKHLRPILIALVVGLSAAPGAPVASHASIGLQTLVIAGGKPDDITVDSHGRLVWGDLASGTIRRFDGKRVSTIARDLSVPEGIAVLSNGDLVVAEQGRDRIVRIDAHGRLTVVHALIPVAGQEGVDGVGLDARTGDLLVPDSPRGAVLRMTTQGARVRILASNLGRPVAAATDRQGNVLVPDEHLGTLVVISPHGRVSYRGLLATPDDVSVAPSGRIWVTSLGDNGLWRMDPGEAPREVLGGLQNPQGLTLDRCGNPIVVEQNSGRIVRLPLTPRSARCAL